MSILTIEAKSAVILVRVVKDIENLINNIPNKFYRAYDVRKEFFSKMGDMDIDRIEDLFRHLIVSPYLLIE